MKTTTFPTFRSAAEFYAQAGWTYDEACEIVRNLMQQGKIAIGKPKTDWSLLGEWAFFVVGTFVAVFAFGAMCAWVQIETACPVWWLGAQAFVLSMVWFGYAIQFTKILMFDTLREI